MKKRVLCKLQRCSPVKCSAPAFALSPDCRDTTK